MRGRIWLIIGAIVGVAMALGHVPYFAGAARAMADTALRLVGGGGNDVIRWASATGAPQRVVLGLGALIAVLAPGLTAWLLVGAARGTLRLRAVAAVVLAVLGVTAYFYHPKGVATGSLVLAFALAGLAIVATGPLVAAPLTALAGLIGGTYLPALWHHRATAERSATEAMHQAIFARPGDPLLLRVVLLVVAAVPFLLGLRAVFRR